MRHRTLATINSIKHFAHFTASVVTSGTRTNRVIISVVAAGAARALTTDVEEGAVIKAFYLEIWADGATASQTVSACISKQPAGSASPTFTEMSNMGAYVNKRNVFEFHQGLGSSGGNIVPFFRGWYKIPKGKQRFALGDDLRVTIAGAGTNVNFCGFATYKEYY